MSEILIKGMEMPKQGWKRLILLPDGEVREICGDEAVRATDARAVELPEPHGALKDVNAIISDIKKQYCHNSRFCDERCSCCDFAEIISVIEYDIPTVLEASK